MQLVAPVVVHCAPPGDAVTVYPVIADPPFEAGATQLTVAEASPAIAVAPVGAPGAVMVGPEDTGMTVLLGLDAALVPSLFVAVTVTV